MQNRINIIAAIQFTPLADLITFVDNYDGTVTIQTNQWRKLQLHEGSGRMTISEAHTAAGRQITTTISGRLKEQTPTSCVGILAVTICGGDTYIIGTDDLPVRIEATTTLTQKSFQITHQNRVKPPVTAI